MTNKTEPQVQEFTLPFVGREEELQFLLGEYDQMLHAQYRSVWIEAPAGMGKTTLVEEFLKRIHGEEPRPLVVHAKLRERSSNSLIVVVEALASVVQTLSDRQREVVFSHLTNFYRERATMFTSTAFLRKMDVTEAMATSGYILRQLSSLVPLVLIIEDVHALKGDVSIEAFRHLQAIIEHVPVLTIFVSRPSLQAPLQRFRARLLRERCEIVELQALDEESIKTLIAASQITVTPKTLLRRSGGNPLLVREMLRRGKHEGLQGASRAQSTDEIIHYLSRELHRLPKKDRQVVALAGLLGEEFSEGLLEGMAQADGINCWTNGVIDRLNAVGIFRRSKKELVAEMGESVQMKVGVFGHALWWEAARVMYKGEKTKARWSEKLLAEVIVPLIVSQEIPPLTDAELLGKLLERVPRQHVIPLLEYVNGLCNIQAQWHTHTNNELTSLLAQSRTRIEKLLQKKGTWLTKEIAMLMVELLDSDAVIDTIQRGRLSIYPKNMELIKLLLEKYIDDDEVLFTIINKRIDEAAWHFHHSVDRYYVLDSMNQVRIAIAKHSSKKDSNHQICAQGAWKQLEGMKYFHEDVGRAVTCFYEAAEIFSQLKDGEGLGMMVPNIKWITALPLPQNICHDVLKFVEQKWKKMSRRELPNLLITRLSAALLYLYWKCGKIREARRFIDNEMNDVLKKAWPPSQRFFLMNIIRRIILSTGELPKNISQNLSVDISGMDAGALLREQEATLFYLEEWETLEQLWHHGKGQLFTSFVIGIPQRLEHIILMNLLLGRDLEEPLEMFRKLKKQYPLMITSVKRIERRVALFISLRKGEMAHCVNDFEYFLTTDQTESEFDKAFAAELFARIAIKYGHHPSKLSSLVKRSLNAYARLKLPKRVVLTAERFLECKLVSKKEYEGILRKYGEKSINEGDAAEEVVEVSQSTADSADEVQEGVYLNCFGRVTVTLSDGKEMVRKYWGKRKKAPSHQRRIIIELVCARYLGKKISRRELLELFYPNVGWNRLSKKRREVYETWLSIRLSQLRRIFSPFFVIERSEGGYILSSSVQTDLFDIRSSLKRAQMLKAQHRPSALWICKKALRKISRGEFAEGVQTERVKKIRKEIREIHQELQLFAASLERDIAHHAS